MWLLCLATARKGLIVDTFYGIKAGINIPYNHYFYLLTIQKEFMANLHSKYLRVIDKLEDKADFHAFLDEHLPETLKKTGGLSYYEMALRFYNYPNADTIRISKTLSKILKFTSLITMDYLKEYENKVIHLDYIRPFVKITAKESELFPDLHLYSGFLTIKRILDGYQFKLYAPAYKHKVIVQGVELFHFAKTERDLESEETPEWVKVVVNSLKMVVYSKIKRLPYEEPTNEKSICYYRDSCKNKVVPSPTLLL